MAKIEPFERYVSEYENWFEKNHFVYESELRAVKTLLPENRKGIEIGVGTGRFAAPLGIKLGLEPSTKMRKIAEERGIKVIEGVAESLPFADALFDFALMVTTICFLDNVKAAFIEVHRILKPGGFFVIGFIDKESILGIEYQRHKQKSEFYKIANFYSVDELVQLMSTIGFNNFAFVQTIFKDLSVITNDEPIKPGYGRGSFVVLRGQK